MSVYVESGLRFDFSKAVRVLEYEALLPKLLGASSTQRNQFWPGIDFHIEDAFDETIWLEVKNWNSAGIKPEEMDDTRKSFLNAMQSQVFAQNIRAKFWGTTSFFAWDNRPLPKNVNFVLLFEPPPSMDSALVQTFGLKINQQLMPPKSLTWRNRMHIAALTLAEWNLRFPEFPAAHL